MIISLYIIEISYLINQNINFVIDLVQFLKSIFVIKVQLLLLSLFQNMKFLIKLNVPGIKNSHLEHKSCGSNCKAQSWQNSGKYHFSDSIDYKFNLILELICRVILLGFHLQNFLKFQKSSLYIFRRIK